MSRFVAIVFALAAAFASTAQAQTQTWPTGPLKIIVPVAPGAGLDILARLLQTPMSQALGQPVVVENRPGGALVVGTDAVIKSTDNHTIGVVISSHVSSAAIGMKLPYDPIKDIRPITMLVEWPNVLVVHPSVSANTVPELIALSKATPGGLSVGIAAYATAQHFCAELFKLQSGANIVPIFYRGGGPAVADLVGGHVKMMFASPGSIMPFIEGKQVRAIAVTGAQPFPALPHLPTVEKAANLPGFANSDWMGMIAPASMPEDVAARLSGIVNATMKTPEFKEQMRKIGMVPMHMAGADMRRFMEQELAAQTKLAQQANIKPQ